MDFRVFSNNNPVDSSMWQKSFANFKKGDLNLNAKNGFEDIRIENWWNGDVLQKSHEYVEKSIAWYHIQI